MNKKALRIAGWALGLSMAVAGIGVAAGASFETPISADAYNATFSKYTGTITEGDYLIVYNGGAMKAAVSSNRLSYTDVTITNNQVSNPSDDLVWHIAPSSTYWTLFNASVAQYAASTGTKNQAGLLTSGSDDKSLWTVNGTSTYEFVNKKNTANSVNANLRKNGTYGFACYATGTGGALTLYKAPSSVAATGVTLNKSTTSIEVGEKETLTATVAPADATNKNVSWSSSDTDVATVDQDGVVTAVAQGNATITVRTQDGNHEASCVVTVSAATSPRITVAGTNSLYVGDDDVTLTATPENFTPASYVWTSSDPSIATVSGTSASGTVHAVAKGEVTITATAKNGLDDVVSNSFTFTVKKFGIAADVSSVSSKANKDTAINITPVDASGDVNVTAVSANTSVATVSVVGSVVTVSTGEYGNTSTNVTISATDGVHVADNIVIPVEVQGGYSVGSKVTALPGSDKLVYLVANKDTEPKYVTSAINKVSGNDSEAALFYLSSTGTLKLKDSSPAAYVYNNGNGTGVSSNPSPAAWGSGMSNGTYPGLLQLSGGRFLAINDDDVKAYAENNLGSYDKIYAYEAVASEATAELNANTASATVGTLDSLTYKLTLSNFLPTGLTVSYLDEGAAEYSESSDIAVVSSGYALGDNAISINFKAVGSTTVKFTVAGAPGGNIDKTLTVNVLPVPTAVNVKVGGQVVAPEYVMSRIVGGYKQPTVEVVPGEASQDYTMTVLSETVDGAFTIDNKKIYFNKVATGVVRITANAMPSVYFDLNVKGDPDVVTSLEATVDKDFYVGDTITKSDITLTATYEVAGAQVIDAANYDFDNYTFTYADAPTGGSAKDVKSFDISFGGRECTLNVNVGRKPYSPAATSAKNLGSTEFAGSGIGGSNSEKQTGTKTIGGVTYSYKGIYVYTKSGTSYLSFGNDLSEGAYFGNSTAFATPISSITVTEQNDSLPNISVSVDGETYVNYASANFETTKYYYYKLTYSSISAYINIMTVGVTLKGVETARTLADYVMYADTTDQCLSKFGTAKSIFESLSTSEKAEFMTGSSHVISTARARLLAWAAHEGKTIELEEGNYVIKSSANRIPFTNGFDDIDASLPVVISALSAGVLIMGALALVRRRREED